MELKSRLYNLFFLEVMGKSDRMLDSQTSGKFKIQNTYNLHMHTEKPLYSIYIQ